jgi:hypothetical protein
MRWFMVGVIELMVVGAAVAGRSENADKVAEQTKAARDNWALLEAGDVASHETEHLLIFAPKTFDKRLQTIGATLEKSFGLAVKALQIKPKDELWPGKLTVYLLNDREQFTAYVRRIDKRRLAEDELGSHFVEGDMPRAAASPARTKGDLSLENQAAAQIAAALLQKRAGAKVLLPEWLLLGFGRATVWRAAPTDKAVGADRKLAQALVTAKKRTAQDVWGGTLEAEESGVLRASLAEFLAYGPGASKFAALVDGFRPGENQESRTTEQAMVSASVDAKQVEARWGPWLLRGSR